MKYQVHFKERMYLALMIAVSLLAYVGIIAALYLGYGAHLRSFAFMGIFLVLNIIGQLFFIGYLRGNAIKVTQRQFPEVYAILTEQSEKLGLKKVPALYLLQGHGMLNAFALRFAGRNFVVFYSSVLEAAYHEDKAAVEFIIGHELGHIKRNHVGALKSLFLLPAQMVPFLSAAYSRACEYTCDSIGYSLCPEGAAKGMLILASGRELSKRVNIRELLANAQLEKGFATWLVEIFSTHPHVVNRIAKFDTLDQRNLVQASFVIDADKADQQREQTL